MLRGIPGKGSLPHLVGPQPVVTQQLVHGGPFGCALVQRSADKVSGRLCLQGEVWPVEVHCGLERALLAGAYSTPHRPCQWSAGLPAQLTRDVGRQRRFQLEDASVGGLPGGGSG